MVGCVIVRGRRVLGEGYHRKFGGPHAEVHALRSAADSVKGATAYVTLEPCSHYGKTPPCADALIAAGIKRVVATMKDPGLHVAGRGMARLRAAGVEVRTGCLGDEARRLNKAYLTLQEHGRPYLILKWAQSIDGRIATASGESRAISGRAAHRWVHRLRARLDGIVVGVGTVLADDPLLTARGVRIHRVATRVVLDSRLRIDARCKLVRTAEQYPTLVFTTRAGMEGRRLHAERLRRAGVDIECCRARRGRVDISAVVRKLGARMMSNVMVEGGGAVLTEFLSRGFVDEAYVFVAPRFIGGDGATVAFGGPMKNELLVTSRRVGPDTLYHADFAAKGGYMFQRRP